MNFNMNFKSKYIFSKNLISKYTIKIFVLSQIILFSLVINNFRVNSQINVQAQGQAIFLPDQYFSYSVPLGNPNIWTKDNLVITMSGFPDAQEGAICSFQLIEYGSTNPEIKPTVTATYTSGSCSMTFAASDQTKPSWNISFTLTNPDSTLYANQPSYFFDYGSNPKINSAIATPLIIGK